MIRKNMINYVRVMYFQRVFRHSMAKSNLKTRLHDLFITYHWNRKIPNYAVKFAYWPPRLCYTLNCLRNLHAFRTWEITWKITNGQLFIRNNVLIFVAIAIVKIVQPWYDGIPLVAICSVRPVLPKWGHGWRVYILIITDSKRHPCEMMARNKNNQYRSRTEKLKILTFHVL